jgi:hypothetical protein
MKTKLFYQQQLWSVALATAIRHGYYFGEDCEHDTKLEIRKAVDRMFANDDIRDSRKLMRARVATIRLVELMIQYMETQGGTRLRLRERSLKRALLSLCPRFPFC